MFDAELTDSLKGVPHKRAWQGGRAGEIVAAPLLAVRAGDGWNAASPPYSFVWNNVARTVATSREQTTVENVRLFALMNISFHGALQTTMMSKFVHGLWGPVTAMNF